MYVCADSFTDAGCRLLRGPTCAQEIPSAEDFLARLPEFDGDMAAKYKEAAGAGKVGPRWSGVGPEEPGAALGRF